MPENSDTRNKQQSSIPPNFTQDVRADMAVRFATMPHSFPPTNPEVIDRSSYIVVALGSTRDLTCEITFEAASNARLELRVRCVCFGELHERSRQNKQMVTVRVKPGDERGVCRGQVQLAVIGQETTYTEFDTSSSFGSFPPTNSALRSDHRTTEGNAGPKPWPLSSRRGIM